MQNISFLKLKKISLRVYYFFGITFINKPKLNEYVQNMTQKILK